MSALDQIIAQRVSVRAYSPRPVSPEDLTAICEAARLAPSACNSQTWRFVAVTHPQVIARIAGEAMRAVIPNRWLAGAPLLIVGCSQLDVVANRIGAGITGIEYYRIDLGIAMEHMVLKATDLGLGTCWIGWFKANKIRQILQIPKRVKVSALLAVGYPKEIPPAKRKRKPLNHIVFAEKWGKPLG